MNTTVTKISLISAATAASLSMFVLPTAQPVQASTKSIHCSIKFLGQYNAVSDRMNGIYKQNCSKSGHDICDLKILGQKSPSTFNGIIKGKGCDYTLKVLAQHGWDCDNKVLGQSTLKTFNGIYKNDCYLTVKTNRPTPTPTPVVTPTPDNTPTPTPTPVVTPTPDNTPTPTPTQDQDQPTPTPTPEQKNDQPQGDNDNQQPESKVLGKVAELPSTGPGLAGVLALGSIGAALIGKKFTMFN